MTESYVKRLSCALLGAITDKDPEVQEQVCSALCSIGEAQPEETLRACEEHLRQQSKLAHPYRALVLRAMEMVLSRHTGKLDKDTANIVIHLASSEMTKTKELVCGWQQAASSVLVAVGRQFINRVMEELLSKFQPGVLPHCSVVQTLANLAVSNVFGMVPFLPSILSTMLPMLGMAKQDEMRVTFCSALQSFSESALEYLANLDQAPDPTVRKDTFAADIFSAYDILFNHWLQSREAKLRLAVVEALGPMSLLLPSERLEEQLPKLLPGVLALYKKHAETFYVSKQSLGQILEAAVSVSSRTLEGQLDALLTALHAQICVPVESLSPLVMSNQKEVLRCFTVLARSAPGRLLAFLLPKLDTSNERLRVGTLQVLKHVINSAAAQMEAQKPFILSSMRLPLLDPNPQVKRAVVQVISAMAHHGYLEQPGGEVMVEYLVQQCALPPEQEPENLGPNSEDLMADSVRAMSIRTLYLVSTAMDRMSDVLWPYLLEFLIPVRFTRALTPLCRSLLHLAQKRQEVGADAFLIQQGAHVRLPSPYAVATRLLVVSSSPYLGGGRGVASLRLLNALHRSVHPLLGQQWETAIPLLLEYLEEYTEETLPQKEWEEKLLLFLRDTLAVVSDNLWVCQLSLEMCRQLPCYNGTPQEKHFLYKCIGTTLGVASSKDVVRKHLQELLETARYQEQADREGLACCFGICASSHLEDVLAQLEDFVRSAVFRKPIGIFNIFKDRSENEVEKVKSGLILCYGHVATQAPREGMLARVESDILPGMFRCFSTKVLGIKVETKDPALKLCLVRSSCMVSHAICSAQASSFHFSRKAELVAQMMELIRAEPVDTLRTPIRKEAMLTCAHLASLEPVLGEQAQADVIQGCLHSVMALVPEPQGEHQGCEEVLYLDTMCALKDLMTSLLQRDVTPQGLQVMVEHLSPWIKSPQGHERVQALSLSGCLLQYFRERLHVSALTPFHNLGLLVGLFSPRCADPWPAARQEAIGCVHALLSLQLCYEGFSRDYCDDSTKRLLALKDGLAHPDPAIMLHTCHIMAQVIAKRLPPDQLISLLLTMFEGLEDPDKNCSQATSAMINCLLQARGSALLEKVPELVSVLRSKLQAAPEHILPAAQHSVYLLASQHCAAVVSSLLGSPLPFDSHTCLLWRALAVEPSLATQVLRLLLERVSRDVPFKENRTFLLGSTPDRVATLLPLSATCALHEVVSAPASGPAVLELYPQLFVALLLRVSCMLGVQLPRNLEAKERRATSLPTATRSLEPCSCAVDALQAVLLRGGSEGVVQGVELEGGWELLRTSSGHEEGTTRLATAMAKCAGPRLPLVTKALICTQNSPYEIQRITSTAFLAELLSSNVVNDLMLLESLLDSLVARQKDPCTSVRRLVLRGLANLASGSPEKVRARGPQLLTAMIGGLDDGDDLHSLVALEAMAGLMRLLPLVEPRDLHPVLLHITIRVRPFFDSEKTEVRTASICLFGHLNEACHGDCEDVFLEQVVSGLVPLLLHLQDPQTPVASACKFALCMSSPNLECEELSGTFQRHLQDGRGLHYGEFLNATCKHLMLHFPDLLGRLVRDSLFYFKSGWEDIRAAAPLFTGFLVLHAESRHWSQVDLEQLLMALQLLLRDPAPLVRVKAAEALGRLVKFA
ncbi:maestro heat-like repeat-containing protein family member 1 isoform X1 [Otolemur garnettii]|uniref:maestro heat-like repeat-containing protein family member 1 isoform X1 n=1 Tax=Otolemur garnettii TaxID=30611 RepID=UPI000C7EC483|nr:maestro heat-like repeat-containing protein family member 1 isoform X1 [Otolemur garnettii]XP_023364136.1 maestro heat-like repeat-containing protein family member 1 isoform X1 [Otolemur garnettii]XP_023364137.1 maestro heat-like repeat-containing protein family member 1 isoform X1 [Otolemur garnettii]XP_023364138.1 maestro heat-like repeat-containing protein family member 1 isoform X1 [Otolemur garnettii]XP_023364139.1 maestro heat-like repeat-containing protein family member 1 isoform X1 [